MPGVVIDDVINTLLLKCLSVTGQIGKGDVVDLDFDHQFIPSGKKDAKYSYKKADGYFPGIAAVGNLIVGIENRDGNTNVRFRQTDMLKSQNRQQNTYNFGYQDTTRAAGVCPRQENTASLS